jgi:hypothetical protein
LDKVKEFKEQIDYLRSFLNFVEKDESYFGMGTVAVLVQFTYSLTKDLVIKSYTEETISNIYVLESRIAELRKCIIDLDKALLALKNGEKPQ